MDAVPERFFRRDLGDILNGVPDDYWKQNGELKDVIWAGTDGIIIKCELADPPSMWGRSVRVWIRGDEVEWLMKILRGVAIDRRKEPMTNG